MKKLIVGIMLLVSVASAAFITVPNTLYQTSKTVIDPKKIDQNFAAITQGLSSGAYDESLYRLYINGVLAIDQNRNLYLNNAQITGNLNVTGVFSVGSGTISTNYFIANFSTSNILYATTATIPTLNASTATVMALNVPTLNAAYATINVLIAPTLNASYAAITSINLNSLSFPSINIFGNIIQSKSNADIIITPNGTGRVQLGKTFGDWITPSVWAVGVTYQATTDIFVIAKVSINGGLATTAFTGSSPSSTIEISQFGNLGGSPVTYTHSFPVRKNDYWRIDNAGTTMLLTRVLPFGI